MSKSKPKFKHWLYVTECGLYLYEKPELVELTDEAYKNLTKYSEGEWDCRLEEGVDYQTVEEPIEHCSACGEKTEGLYNFEGDYLYCKGCLS